MAASANGLGGAEQRMTVAQLQAAVEGPVECRTEDFLAQHRHAVGDHQQQQHFGRRLEGGERGAQEIEVHSIPAIKRVICFSSPARG
jgi:hypothetical protein